MTNHDNARVIMKMLLGLDLVNEPVERMVNHHNGNDVFFVGDGILLVSQYDVACLVGQVTYLNAGQSKEPEFDSSGQMKISNPEWPSR